MARTVYELELKNEVLRERDASGGETMKRKLAEVVGLRQTIRDQADQIIRLKYDLAAAAKARDEAIEGKRNLSATCDAVKRAAVEQATKALESRLAGALRANRVWVEENLKLKARLAELEQAPRLHYAAAPLKSFPVPQAIGRPKRVEIVHDAACDCWGIPMRTVAENPREVTITW
jgi:hypothetical protein